uniref:Uncharacterized protein n=1 Tax=Rhizophora mucronata TaxID=61149 RepID=A0A2P2N6A4_RHIMU
MFRKNNCRVLASESQQPINTNAVMEFMPSTVSTMIYQ